MQYVQIPLYELQSYIEGINDAKKTESMLTWNYKLAVGLAKDNLICKVTLKPNQLVW